MKTVQQLTNDNKDKLHEFEQLLAYEFADIALLQRALVHSSYGFEKINTGENNETLEFLGDAVLDLAVSDMLFKTYPRVTEGELTKMRAGLVKEITLAEMAMNLSLGNFLMLGRGEETSQGRQKNSILASAFEAIIGAIYLDRGYDSAYLFVSTQFTALLPAKKEEILIEDAKSRLQEKLQEQFNQAPMYHVDKEEGPAHARKFTMSVRFGDMVLGIGSGSSKKVAEQRAAETALDIIDTWWEKLKKRVQQH
ncbi:MAG: ribonuclease III [Deltaproteobacteria bacterium]|jgi:ribonuclease-3|nr:ribonuclease III [Deltaproteobacteria bacterium]